MPTKHSDAKSWREDWDEIAQGPSGGQADSYTAKRRDGTVGCAFIKVLKEQTSSERRARLFREASSLETLKVDFVPVLLETNARHYKDLDFELFIASEFVEGANLRNHNVPVSGKKAIDWSRALCRILSICHDTDVRHRDVKPENCIVDHEGAIWLVDFGLSYLEGNDPSSFETRVGQEIGNRFLRLPELSAGSEFKDDFRTDIAGCVGMLFYLLTGVTPRVLRDAKDLPPHQRSSASEILRSVDVPRRDRLLALFDQGFEHDLDKRFQSAVSLVEALDRCLELAGSNEDSAAILARLQEKTTSSTYLASKNLIKKLQAIGGQINTVTDQIVGQLNGLVSAVSSSNKTDAASATYTHRFGFIYSANGRMFIPDYVIRHVGTEITLQAIIDGNEEFDMRIPTEPGRLSSIELELLKTYLLGKIAQIDAEES